MPPTCGGAGALGGASASVLTLAAVLGDEIMRDDVPEGRMFNVRLSLDVWKGLEVASLNLRRPAADIVLDAIAAHLKSIGAR